MYTTNVLFTLTSRQPRKHCSMHTCNLGSFTILNAEGLIMLAEHRATVWHCTFDEALRHLDPDFRSWTHMNRASCSHRLWGAKHLHMENNDGARTFPWLNAKAYNARVILAGLAATSLHFFMGILLHIFAIWYQVPQPCPNVPPQAGLSQGQSQMLSQIEGGSAHAWADRKQLWGAGIAAVFPVCNHHHFLRNPETFFRDHDDYWFSLSCWIQVQLGWMAKAVRTSSALLEWCSSEPPSRSWDAMHSLVQFQRCRGGHPGSTSLANIAKTTYFSPYDFGFACELSECSAISLF